VYVANSSFLEFFGTSSFESRPVPGGAHGSLAKREERPVLFFFHLSTSTHTDVDKRKARCDDPAYLYTFALVVLHLLLQARAVLADIFLQKVLATQVIFCRLATFPGLVVEACRADVATILDFEALGVLL
jgi:hypothetical protein